MPSTKELESRQLIAANLGRSIARVIGSHPSLRAEVALALWHGSLVLGRGGSVYDFDYAFFVHHEQPKTLVEFSEALSRCVEDGIEEIRWRRDAHFDGFGMFEAHTHWDFRHGELPHVGVHVCSSRALEELLGEQVWSRAGGHTRAIDAWIRYGVFLRNWVYEGRPLYEAHGLWARLQQLPATPPKELMDWLASALKQASAYRPHQDGHKTCFEGEPRAFELAAVLAYGIEGMPLGRRKRYIDDINAFSNPHARSLLSASVNQDWQAIAELMRSPLSNC